MQLYSFSRTIILFGILQWRYTIKHIGYKCPVFQVCVLDSIKFKLIKKRLHWALSPSQTMYTQRILDVVYCYVVGLGLYMYGAKRELVGDSKLLNYFNSQTDLLEQHRLRHHDTSSRGK